MIIFQLLFGMLIAFTAGIALGLYLENGEWKKREERRRKQDREYYGRENDK